MEVNTDNMTDEQKVEHAIAIRDEAGALSVVEKSNVLVVDSTESKEQSIEIEKQAKLEKKRDLEFLDPFVENRHKAHKKATQTRSDRVSKYDKVISNEGEKRAAYTQKEIARIGEETRVRAEKEAAERAERLATAQKAVDEAIGTCVDSHDTIQLLHMMLEDDNPSDEEAEIIRARIKTEQAVLDGANRAAAEEAAQATLVVETPPTPPAADLAPKSKGEVQGFAYKVTVTDMKALCQAIGEGSVPTAAVKEAQGKLNSYAKDGMIKHGEFGCHVVKTPTSHTRG